jgi:membrane-associated protease RseP (regulator of RpoE activity)
MLGILVFLVGLFVSIAVHEAGHMVAARRSGGRVSEFMVGFGPSIVSFKRGHTRYGLKAIPFGGYVRILGMRPSGQGDPAETEEEKAVPGEDFYRLSTPRRTVTLLAGPFANLLLAGVLLTFVVSVLGIPAASSRVGVVRECVSAVACSAEDSASPALLAGLQVGDKIVALDGVSVSSWDAISEGISSRTPGDTLEITIESDGVSRTVKTLLAANPTAPDAALLGISPWIVSERRAPTMVPGLLIEQSRSVLIAVLGFPVRVLETFGDSLRGEERDPAGPIGLVGVGRIGADIGDAPAPMSTRLGQLLVLLAGLNVSLGVFNLIPLLPLDGGHIALTWFETLRSRLARMRRHADPGPVDMRRLMPLTNIVIAFFIVSTVLLLFADVVNPVHMP